MGLFSNLMSKIFTHAPAAPVATVTTAPASTASSTEATAAPTAASSAPAAAAPAAPAKVVDVAAILDELAAKNPEKLDWRKSIVDLMKLVGMDSSFGARKELAKELNYTGSTSDSAAMNVWLHKQVLTKLSENGGKVPAELLD